MNELRHDFSSTAWSEVPGLLNTAESTKPRRRHERSSAGNSSFLSFMVFFLFFFSLSFSSQPKCPPEASDRVLCSQNSKASWEQRSSHRSPPMVLELDTQKFGINPMCETCGTSGGDHCSSLSGEEVPVVPWMVLASPDLFICRSGALKSH